MFESSRRGFLRGFITLAGGAVLVAAPLSIVTQALILPDDNDLIYTSLHGNGVTMQGWERVGVMRHFMREYAACGPFEYRGKPEVNEIIRQKLTAYGDTVNLLANPPSEAERRNFLI